LAWRSVGKKSFFLLPSLPLLFPTIRYFLSLLHLHSPSSLLPLLPSFLVTQVLTLSPSTAPLQRAQPRFRRHLPRLGPHLQHNLCQPRSDSEGCFRVEVVFSCLYYTFSVFLSSAPPLSELVYPLFFTVVTPLLHSLFATLA
jgi:hypothetical protein